MSALLSTALAAFLIIPDAAAGMEGSLPGSSGAVFVMGNSADATRGNAIVMYRRAASGALTLTGYFPTGGKGSGPAPTSTILGSPVPFNADGLGSSNSLLLSGDHRCLYAVNAGSHSVSSFRIYPTGLRLVKVIDSGGVFPVSLALKRSRLYVLNSGQEGTLAAFAVNAKCDMAAAPGASRSLAAYTADVFPTPAPNEILTTPAQVSFTPKGTQLVVSMKGGPASDFGGRVVVFPVDEQGTISGSGTATPFSVSEQTGGPFSFVFDPRGRLILTQVNSGTVSVYRIDAQTHALQAVGNPISAKYPFPCWIARSGRYVYVVNFGHVPATNGGNPDGPGVIVGFTNSPGGLQDNGVMESYPDALIGNHGIDLAVVTAGGSSYLYFLQPRAGKIGMRKINADGTLTSLGEVGGLSQGVDPFAGTNPGISLFQERCFLQDPDSLSPECLKGSAQGITGY